MCIFIATVCFSSHQPHAICLDFQLNIFVNSTVGKFFVEAPRVVLITVAKLDTVFFHKILSIYF